MLGTTAPSSLCQHYSVQPLQIQTASWHTLQSSRNSEAHRRCCIRCSAAAAAASVAAANIVDQPADNGVSMHPDAVRRRQEAEARYIERTFNVQAPRCVTLKIFLRVGEKRGKKKLHMRRLTCGEHALSGCV